MKSALTSLLLVAVSLMSFSTVAAAGIPIGADADADAARAIDARFHADDLIAFVDVDVRVKNGVATLVGTVRSPQAKAAAIREARAIAGVTDIVSQIRVRPSLL